MTIAKTTLNRRSFLQVSAAAGGGMVIGFNWLVSCTPAEMAALEMPEEWHEINAFLKIGENGVVTIFSPNPEIGQNVKTSMPMIVAEELDVDWANVIVEQAPLNTVKYSRQTAGGSQSIRRSWEGLRTAGATARRMLMETAAKNWNVPVEELSTESGVISHSTSGNSVTYGEIASAAASAEVPAEVQLKDPADFKIIGSSRKNVDGAKIARGEPLFGLDYYREGMLTAMIVHPPAFGMKLKSVDDREAKAMPGIREIFTINTVPEGETGRPTTYAFPEMVAIVGNSTWELMKARRALKIEWEVNGALESSDDHESAFLKVLSERRSTPDRKDGEPEKVFANAAQVIERTYSAPFLAHNTMEPMNFFANVTEDSVELVGPVQTPESLRRSVAQRLSLEESQVTVELTRQGGGFGRRLYGNPGEEAALISHRMKAPVKLVYSREDDMTQGTYRPAYKVTYRAAFNEGKELIAFEVRGVGIHGGPVIANRFPAGTVDHYLADNLSVDSNISTGAWRAPRSNFIAYAEQSFIDEVAEVAGKDPIDFRLQLFQRAIENPVGERNDYEPERYAGVLKLVRDKANWGGEMPGVYRGVSAYFCHNTYVAQIMDVIMQDGQPKIDKVWCAVDCGIVVNLDAARNLIEGGIVDGIGHAMYSGLTFRNGRPDQSNFNNYRMIRQSEAPREIEVFFVESTVDPTGLGEPPLPPAMAALANALAKATGRRYYHQPFMGDTEILG